MKKIIALVLALAMVATLGLAFADQTSVHSITINNTDQFVPHTYKAYQVFQGVADETGTKIANVTWGNGVNSTAIISALAASTDASLAALKTIAADGSLDANQKAAKLVEALGKFTDTSASDASAGALDAFGDIVSAHIDGSGAAFTQNGTAYTASVTGDGYYIIIDSTTTLKNDNGADTKSKNILLPVLKNVTDINAKDTHMTPDKEILKAAGQSFTRVKEDSAAVGDTVKFEVTIPVPNTKKYVDHFVFNMVDQLPKGMTFTGITSVKVGEANVPYVLYIGDAKQDPFTAPTDPVDANAPATAQQIKLVFTNFKANAENATPTWIGNNLVVTYTAVVNKNADFTPTGNENEVKFIYSNDPNHDYDGDEPKVDEPVGETPEDKTKTVLANIIVLKTDGTNALAGAEFKIESNDVYNVTLVTGEKFEEAPYTPEDGETEVSTGWYKLKDGSYTQTVPTDTNRTSYASDSTTYVKVAFEHFVTDALAPQKVTVYSDENGLIKLEGLKPGTYTITETHAPTGFNLDSTPHTIVISAVYDTNTKKIALSGTVDGSAKGWDGDTATASITIENKAGTVLPSTGGIGTTIFYILGGLLVVGAAVILVARRKAQD